MTTAETVEGKINALTPDQRALYELMSVWSETYWCAAWMNDTENLVWKDDSVLAQSIKSVAELCGYWIKEDDGPVAVPLEQWKQSLDPTMGTVTFTKTSTAIQFDGTVESWERIMKTLPWDDCSPSWRVGTINPQISVWGHIEYVTPGDWVTTDASGQMIVVPEVRVDK